jgi:Zn finger protein HypA/HybF involved in hydrogenase expression
MRFCACGGKTKYMIDTDPYEFHCMRCGNIYEGTDDGVSVSHRLHGRSTTSSKDDVLLKTAIFDPTVQKIEGKCAKCPNKYLAVVVVGDKKVILICDKCGSQQRQDVKIMRFR